MQQIIVCLLSKFMSFITKKVITNIRGLFAHATTVPDAVVHTSEGLATIQGVMRYVSPDQTATVTAANSGKTKVANLEIDTSNVVSVHYGSEVNVGTAGTSKSGFNPAETTAGGKIKVNVDNDGAQTVTIAPESTGSAIAADIQSGVQALTANNPSHQASISAFTATFVGAGIVATYSSTGINPNRIAFDGTNMWTANLGDNSVSKVAPNGTITTYTSIAPVSQAPVGIAFDGTNMWTSNTDGSVSKVTPSGTPTVYSNAFDTGGKGIAFDGTNMWVCNDHGQIAKVTPSGTFTIYSGPSSAPLFGIAFDGTNMWATDNNNNKVWKIDPTGTVTTYTVAREPFGIAFDGTNMWTSSSHGNVSKVAPNGTFTEYNFAVQSFLGIAFDGTNMWMTESNNNTVWKLDPAGSPTIYSSTGTGPRGIAFDGVSNMWTADRTGNTVTKVSVVSRYTLTSGSTGTSSTVVVTDSGISNIAPALKLGVANGGTETAGTGTPPAYPTTASNKLLLARLFTPSSPITSTTTTVTNANINNNVFGR